MNALSLLTSLVFGATALQDAPVDIPKAELPKTSTCVVCSANGSDHGVERVVAGVRWKGAAYYFCAAAEVAEFKRDPEGFVPPVFPRPALPWKAAGLDGKAVDLGHYEGRVVLLDFWATWCAPCIDAMPELDRLHKRYRANGFSVVGLSIDEEPAKATAFWKRRKFEYPTLLDSAEQPTWQAYGVRAIPALFLIDRKGRIVAQWRGKPPLKVIEAEVRKALGVD